MHIRDILDKLTPPALALLCHLAFPVTVLAHGDEAHGDHNPHHGGLVMMHNDLHFEVVRLRSGGLRVYYTDAVRAELPAAVASAVAVSIESAGRPARTVEMAISAGGDFWEGASTPIEDPRAIVRIGFLFQGDPLEVDIPAYIIPVRAAAAESGMTAHTGD